MKHLLPLLLLLFVAPLCAQNTYHLPLEINRPQRWLRSEAANLADRNTYLLLYQHGGARITRSGTSIGSVFDRNGAGQYDLNRVSRINGDTVFLALPLRNDYALGATQIVLYQSGATHTISGMQTVDQVYDGSRGGVLFRAAGDTLRLTDGTSLDATGAGFRGGGGTEAESECSRFTRADGEVYAAGNWRGASRGEGIGGIPAGQEFGRAGAANGGGGGNDHNAGGGGGANVAAGGTGARNLVSGILNGACRGVYPGRGGFPLAADPTAVYFGGGGGAGHANNTTLARGKNGGGLIVLWAPHVIFGNEVSLRAGAEGEIPGETISGDGGGGGGAGGSVLLVGGQLRGSPTVTLSGSDGVSTVNRADRCFGPGGGGAGGRLVTRAAERTAFTPLVNAAGGAAGLRLQSSECAPTAEPGVAGGTGQTENYALALPFGRLSQSTDSLCGPGGILITDQSIAAESVDFVVTPADPDLGLTRNGRDLLLTYTGRRGGTFTITQSVFANGLTYPGDTATVTFLPVASVGNLQVTRDGEVLTITLTDTVNVRRVRYDFGDGTVLDTLATGFVYRYASGGTYPLTVTLANGPCPDSMIYEETIVVPAFTVAIINQKDARGCVPLTVLLRDESLNAPPNREWLFPGGNPTTSTEANVEITYDTPGTYTALLRLLNGTGPDTIDSILIEVFAVPVADFSVSVDTATATFTDLTDGATRWRWDFGDGGMSAEQNPTHTYDSTGVFLVSLIVGNDNCRDTLRREVTIGVLSGVTDLAAVGVRLYPNPTTGVFYVDGPATITEVRDLNGRPLRRGGGQSVDLSGLPAGPYLVLLATRTRQYSTVIIKRE